MTSRIPAIVCLFAISVLFAEAQSIPDPVPQPAPAATAEAAEMSMPGDDVVLELPVAAPPATAVSREAETISVDFPNEEVRTIIRNVADLYDLNVVVPETLVGTVSIKLRNVTWRQVFHVVLEPLGYTFVEDGNIIKIKGMDEMAREAVKTTVYVINFATATELQSSIAPLVDSAAGGRIQVDKRANALIITERPSRMGAIQEIIDRLDRPTEQVMIESKFVELTNRDTEALGINHNSLAAFQVGAGPFQRQYDRTSSQDRTSNDGLKTDNVTNNSNSTSTLNSSSVITGTTPSTKNENSRDLATEAGNTLTTTLDSSFSVLNNMTVGRVDTAIFNADAFEAVISALSTANDIEVVSNPTVVTVNNTAAQINIGEEFPVPRYTYNEQRGSFEVAGFDYKAIGIILKVTPQVNSAGFINLDIVPEISSRTGTVSFGGAGGAEIPIITTRKTMSTVTIKSGFTLAIGGLIEKTARKTTSQVPLLGDLPLIGYAFRHKNNSEDKRNLIIFITAKVLSPEGSTYRDIFSARNLYEMGIKSRDLPGYETPKTEQELFDNIQNARDNLEQIQAESMLRSQLDTLNKGTQKAQKKADSEAVKSSKSNIPKPVQPAARNR